jgi:hypothetical protein
MEAKKRLPVVTFVISFATVSAWFRLYGTHFDGLEEYRFVFAVPSFSSFLIVIRFYRTQSGAGRGHLWPPKRRRQPSGRVSCVICSLSFRRPSEDFLAPATETKEKPGTASGFARFVTIHSACVKISAPRRLMTETRACDCFHFRSV